MAKTDGKEKKELGPLPPTIEEFLISIHPDFIPMMRKYKDNVIVSGSMAVYYYMLSHGLEPGFIPGDVDIFTTEKDPECVKFLEELLKEINGKEGKKYNIFRFRDGKSALERVDFGTLKDGRKIDIIKISEKFEGSAVDFIKIDFDLEICKCWYDGVMSHGNYEVLKARQCELTKIHTATRPRMDPLKLINYFKAIRSLDPTMPARYDEEDTYRALSRIRKYTARGFKIDTSRLEIPKEIIEDYLSTFVMLVNAHIDKPVNVIFCHDDMTKVDLEKINKALNKIT